MKKESRLSELLNHFLLCLLVLWLMVGQIKFESDSVVVRYNGILHCMSDQMSDVPEPRRFFELHVK